MSRGRNTLLLVVAAVVIGGYVYFVEMKRTPASEAGETRPKVFGADLDAAKIEELQVKSSSGDRTALKKSGGNWQIVEPLQSGVDDSEVSGITTNLSTLESSRVIEENPKDLGKYGLATPRVEVAFKATGDKDFRRLLVGAKTPTGGDLYAKLANEQKVVLIPSYLESTLDRSTFQLRDKSVLKFDRDKVDSVEVATGATAMTFTKQGDQWTLTQPWRARTDSTAVDSLIGRIASGQMKSLVAPEAQDAALGGYGLAKPEARITLGAGSARSALLVGKASADGAAGGAAGTGAKPAPPTPPTLPTLPGATAEPEAGGGDGVYARDAARGMVFTIDKSLADDLKKGPADYRKKDVFDFREFNGTKLDVTRGGATVTFEKRAPPPAAPAAKDATAAKDAAGNPVTPDTTPKWAQTQPAAKVDEAKINDVASKVASLRADTFVEKLPAGAAEVVTVSAAFDEGKKTEKVVIYKAGADYFAVRPDDAGAAKLPAAGVEELVKSLDAAK